MNKISKIGVVFLTGILLTNGNSIRNNRLEIYAAGITADDFYNNLPDAKPKEEKKVIEEQKIVPKPTVTSGTSDGPEKLGERFQEPKKLERRDDPKKTEQPKKKNDTEKIKKEEKKEDKKVEPKKVNTKVKEKVDSNKNKKSETKAIKTEKKNKTENKDNEPKEQDEKEEVKIEQIEVIAPDIKEEDVKVTEDNTITILEKEVPGMVVSPIVTTHDGIRTQYLTRAEFGDMIFNTLDMRVYREDGPYKDIKGTPYEKPVNVIIQNQYMRPYVNSEFGAWDIIKWDEALKVMNRVRKKYDGKINDVWEINNLPMQYIVYRAKLNKSERLDAPTKSQIRDMYRIETVKYWSMME